MASADVLALKAERSDLIALLRAYTTLWVQAGMPGDFQVGVDGESYDWSHWRKQKLDEIAQLTELIKDLSSPWCVRTRGG